MSESTIERDTTGFYPMPKIARHNRKIVVSEKLDGTNACILINDEGVSAGSKNRILTPGKSTDNFGFAAWVESCSDDLASALGPGLHRGEWFGLGINRGYGLIERRFSLFNTEKWTGPYNDLLLPSGVHVVPKLYTGLNDDYWIKRSLTLLREQGSYAVPGYRNPEGIVIYHTASNTMTKITLEGDEYPKGLTND